MSFRSLRAAALVATLVLVAPLVTPTAMAAFSATITPTAANEWWVQVSVKASGPLAGVDAKVGTGTWKPLTLHSYGWSASMAAPAGSIVEFRARETAGGVALSGCYLWTSRAPTACPGSTNATTTPTTTGTPTGLFTAKGGNEWWVQVLVAGSPTKVEARDTDGAWAALSLRSWGAWAGSIHVEPGHDVQYRATFANGTVATSCWYDHPGTTCVASAPAPSPPPAPSSTALWKDSFTSSPWSAPWQLASIWGSSNLAVTHEAGASVPTFMRVKFPAGSASPALQDSAGAPLGGAEWKGRLGIEARDALHLRYQVRFPVGFDFVKGGKLPGLYGGTGNSGGNIPDGTDGWSTRLMWRTGGAGEVYAYLPTSSTWGSSLGPGSWKFVADGTWHAVEQEVVLNTPGSADGEVKIWYDGTLVHQAKGLKFRTTSALKVDGIFFSTFFGGSDASWATPKSVHADFANFAVSTGYIGP